MFVTVDQHRTSGGVQDKSVSIGEVVAIKNVCECSEFCPEPWLICRKSVNERQIDCPAEATSG